MKNTIYCTFFYALWLLVLLGNAHIAQAQWAFQLPSGSYVKITTTTSGICQPPRGIYYSQFEYDNEQRLQAAFAQTPPAHYYKAEAGKPFQVTVEVTNSNHAQYPYSAVVGLIGRDAPPYLWDLDNIKPTGIEEYISNEYGVGSRRVFHLGFGVADIKGWVSFILYDYTPGLPGVYQLVLPFVVEGVFDHQVPILGTTVRPQIPYLILHAPPGDGSRSEFQESRTTCREYQESYAEDNSLSANLAVKLGVAGSAGFIVTTSFEFSVTFSAGVTTGALDIKTSGNQTCVTVGAGFSTSELTGPDGGGDVFIGYGTDLAFGFYRFIAADTTTCTPKMDSGLIYTPIGTPRRFAYTRTAILSEIDFLKGIVADTTLTPRQRNNAENQIDVWNQVLTMNEANVNNPANALIEPISFSAGVSAFQESSITVTETHTIQYEHYIEGNVGIQTVVEVGGSGISGGLEYRGSSRMGKTQNQSQQSSRLVRYTLADDDSGDLFNLDVFRDPMYGTPIFKTKPGTRSSCPYQGGYQRDQPRLKHDGSNDSRITLLGTPLGTSATFKIDLCNESNEARTYNLKLNALSNLNGAVVSAAGVPLNGNDLGQSFTIPASTCVQDLVVEVRMLSPNSPKAYPNLELFLYAPCEEGIQSSVFASVYFGDATSADEATANVAQVQLFPNPSKGWVNIAYALREPAPVRIAVYDLTGRLLHTADTDEHQDLPNQTRLDVSALPDGMYIVELQSLGTRLAKLLAKMQ